MGNNKVCELCGKPAEYQPDVTLCETCENDLNKEPGRLREFEERRRIRGDTELHEIPRPKFITRRTTAFVIDGLIVAPMSLWLGGGFWWLVAIGVIVGVRRNRVAMIENKVDGTKKQYNPFLPK